MRLYELDLKQCENLSCVIPTEYIEQMKAWPINAFGLFEEDGLSDEFIGVMLLKKNNGWINLLWMCVREEYKNKGYGQSMLVRLIENVSDMNVMVKHGIFDESERTLGIGAEFDIDDSLMNEVFEKCGFSVRENSTGCYTVKKSDLDEIKLGDSRSMTKKVIPFKNMLNETKNLLLKTIAEDERDIPFPIDFKKGKYDGNLSGIFVENGKPLGALLISKRDDNGNYNMDCLWALNPLAIIPLLTFAKEAAEKIDNFNEISISAINSTSESMVKKLLPNIESINQYVATYTFI